MAHRKGVKMDDMLSLLNISEEREKQLIKFAVKIFAEASTVADIGFVVDAGKIIVGIEKELDITRQESLFIAFKLGEACGDKIKGIKLYLYHRLKEEEE